MAKSALSHRLRTARMMAGLSMRDVDRYAGICGGLTGSIERGDRPNPGAETIGRLCTALGISADWLIMGEGPEPDFATIRQAVEKLKNPPTAA